MPISRERFEQGLSYSDYKAQMKVNQERFLASESSAELDAADVAFFAGLPQLNVVVITEDWCGDAIANVPLLGRLAEASPNLNLRVFLRDQNLDIMDQYLKEGKYRSIPVFVFFDEDFRELGHWIETPKAIGELRAKEMAEFIANDVVLSSVPAGTGFGEMPEEARNRMMGFFGQFRERTRRFSDREVLREIAEIVAPALGVAVHRTSSENVIGEASEQKLSKVVITYCSECGYEQPTIELASALMRECGRQISAIEIVPWHDGTFDVTVNGNLVHSMYRDGGFPEASTIINAIRG
jgi:selT/selW/selH-like putative selenoprotein